MNGLAKTKSEAVCRTRLRRLQFALKDIANGLHDRLEYGVCSRECPPCLADNALGRNKIEMPESGDVPFDAWQIASLIIFPSTMEDARKRVAMELQRAYDRGKRDAANHVVPIGAGRLRILKSESKSERNGMPHE